jgi:hypothetical protein
MTFEGTVQGGVVVLEPGAKLADGTLVRVEPIAMPVSQEGRKECDIFRMGDLAVDTGISDLATNIDHYMYGHPRVTDAG